MAREYPAKGGMLREEAALPRRGTAKVRDDGQKSSIRRMHRDESAHQDKVLYPSQGVSVNSAFTYRKTCVYPGRSVTMSTNGLTEPQGEVITWRKSAEGIIAGGNEPSLPNREKYTRRSHPGKGPNGDPSRKAWVNDND